MRESVVVVYGVKEKWGKELRNRVGRWGRRALWKYIEKRKKSDQNGGKKWAGCNFGILVFWAGYNFDIVSLKLQLKRMGLFESLGLSHHLHKDLLLLIKK